jgi:hypothetical protein
MKTEFFFEVSRNLAAADFPESRPRGELGEKISSARRDRGMEFRQQIGVLQRAGGLADEYISRGMGEKNHRI